jgi:hypothetical protein
MPQRKKATKSGLPQRIYVLRVTLLDVEPLVWRELHVPSRISLERLDMLLQKAMGWTNSHLHQFIAGREVFGPTDIDEEFAERVVNERQVALEDVARRPGCSFLYEYDFGDGWEHEVKVIGQYAANPNEKYPQCSAGERACPPEDCGGPHGYIELLEAISDESHERHDELSTWLGEFSPDAFDSKAVTRTLQSAR